MFYLKIKIGGTEPDEEEYEKKKPGPWCKTKPKIKKKASPDPMVGSESSPNTASDTLVGSVDKNSLALDNTESPIPMDLT